MLFAGTLGGPPEGYSPVSLKGQGAQVLWKGFSGAGHLFASCRGPWVGAGSKITWKKASQTHRDNSSQCQSRPCGPASDSAPHVPPPGSPQPWAPPAQILFAAVRLRPPGVLLSQLGLASTWSWSRRARQGRAEAGTGSGAQSGQIASQWGDAWRGGHFLVGIW